MIVVYCTRPSAGAYRVVEWLNENGHAAVRIKGGGYHRLNPTLLIGWGEQLPHRAARMLNPNAGSMGKFRELTTLARAGVPVPRASSTPREGWLARASSHADGADLLKKPDHPAFFVEVVPSDYEYRMNVFRDRVFRTGLKIPMKDKEAHPFVRTGAGGWTWTYDQGRLDRVGNSASRRVFREAAVAAVAAMGLDFGAVDIGRRSDGTPVVYEVNSAPAMEQSDIARWGGIFAEENARESR